MALSTSNRSHHQPIGIVHEIELVLIRGYVDIVVYSLVKGTHLVDAGIKIDIVTSPKDAVWRIQVRSWSKGLVVELLQLSWRWYDHIFSSLSACIVVVVVMVVMDVTEVRIDETVGLYLSLWLIMKMAMHTLKVASMTLGVMRMMEIVLLILLRLPFLLRFCWLYRLLHVQHCGFVIVLQRIVHIYHNIMECFLLSCQLRWCEYLWRVR
jgi:hypothetical protein